MENILHIFAFLAGAGIILTTLSSAVSTFVLPRSARSQLNRLVFGVMRRLVELLIRFAKTYDQKTTFPVGRNREYPSTPIALMA